MNKEYAYFYSTQKAKFKLLTFSIFLVLSLILAYSQVNFGYLIPSIPFIILIIKWGLIWMNKRPQLTISPQGIYTPKLGLISYEQVISVDAVDFSNGTEITICKYIPEIQDIEIVKINCVHLDIETDKLKTEFKSVEHLFNKNPKIRSDLDPLYNEYDHVDTPNWIVLILQKLQLNKSGKSNNLIYNILIFVGILCFFFIGHIYLLDTIISNWACGAILISIGFLASLFTIHHFKRKYQGHKLVIWIRAILINACGIGLILSSFLAYLNFEYGHERLSKEHIININHVFKVKHKEYNSIRVSFDYEGIKVKRFFKELDYLYHQQYQKIKLNTYPGLFNFPIIKDSYVLDSKNTVIDPSSFEFIKPIKITTNLHDSLAQKELKNGYLTIKSGSYFDSIGYSDYDTLFGYIDFDKIYQVEFHAEGYQSKAMIFNTTNLSIDDKKFTYEIGGFEVHLVKEEGFRAIDTVATWYFNQETEYFTFK